MQCGAQGDFVRCGRRPWREEHLFDFVSAHSASHTLIAILTTAGVVDNLLHDAPDVSIALSLCPLAIARNCGSALRNRARGGTYVVERAELGRRLVQAGVGGEDGAATLTLVPDNPTHGDGVVW